jgi:cation:H+ antiporter
LIISIAILIVAVLILYFGAELSLDSSEKLGQKLGLSPLIIGMLLIGFGTSLPEFFVAHIAGVQGKSDIAVGSLIGSNIANMFLVLGVSGFVAKISLSNFSVKKQTVIHLILALVLAFCLSQASLTIITASPLLLLCCFYLYVLYKEMKSSTDEVPVDDSFHSGKVFLKLIVGFSFLYLGGELLVKSGTDICAEIGISEYVISAIFIAFGTSFPELVTSLLAASKKKDTDLIVGNIIGSNLFNCAFILGSLGIYDFSFSKDFTFELVALFLGSIVLVILSYTNRIFYRKTSFLFMSSYFIMVAHWLKVF